MSVVTSFDQLNHEDIADEDNCIECDEVESGLEKIDDETDALDITFVKVNDPRYAKKYGVNKLPALVYFRRKFPSIYRGNKYQINCWYGNKSLIVLRIALR